MPHITYTTTVCKVARMEINYRVNGFEPHVAIYQLIVGTFRKHKILNSVFYVHDDPHACAST